MNIKKCTIICVISLGLILILSMIGGVLESSGIVTKESVGPLGIKIILAIYVALFIIPAFAVVPPFLRAFTMLQRAIGHGDFVIIKFIRKNERNITYCIWVIFLFGIIMALPFAIKDWFIN